MTKTRSTAWIVLLSLAAPAAAQDTGPFSELARLVEAGDDVRVTLRGGRSMKARIAGVTSNTLSVFDRGNHRDLGETDVWAVSRRPEDSNANGAWLGFAAGAAYGVYVAMSIWETPPPDTGEVVKGLTTVGGLFGAAGAWGGYAIDRFIRREEEVYRRSARPRLAIAPRLSPDRRGVAVSLSF